MTLERESVAGSAAIGTRSGAELLALLQSVPPRDRDVWVDRMLGLGEPPADAPDLPQGAVPYLPSGVAEILAMVRDVPVRADDVVVDLGAGLGRVVMLTHLLTGAVARGIEIQAPLVAAARACSAALGLRREDVSFECANAAATELDGSIFYLYAPFNGDMLTAVVKRLEAVARRRAIVVCTTDLELRDVSWLRARASSALSQTIYDSIVPGVSPRAPTS